MTFNFLGISGSPVTKGNNYDPYQHWLVRSHTIDKASRIW